MVNIDVHTGFRRHYNMVLPLYSDSRGRRRTQHLSVEIKAGADLRTVIG